MAKSVIFCVVILALVLTASLMAERYVGDVCSRMLSVLEDESKSLEGRFSDAHNIWKESKNILMLISNHKDIESVSLSLIRGRESARLGGELSARTELKSVLFLIREFAVRDKLSAENVV